ncbi:MAG: hypothetical protein J6Q51_03275 [Clostridia bacterium]|nr:hypothetical protein [Clostridia bacterium]
MDSRDFLTRVKNVLRAYELALDKSTFSKECEDLDASIFELYEYVGYLSAKEYEQLNHSLTSRISKLKSKNLSNNLEDKKRLKFLQKALGYLEFYHHCPVDFYNISNTDKTVIDKKYDGSDFKAISSQIFFDKKKQECLKYILIQKELKLAYEKIKLETGCGFLCLNAYNHGALCGLPSKYTLRLSAIGPINQKENMYIPYTEEYKVIPKDGLYTAEEFKQFINNTNKSISLYTRLIDAFVDIKNKGEFKGLFYTYSGDELIHFVDDNINMFKNNINLLQKNIDDLQTTIKNTEFISTKN